ncbi:nuclear transport factor 2 family protein [Nocardia sp. NPDC057440]|uniref:nuclear transport factor 2 family protein n=1 Tax=Nocardia sp. NPDC057440 TaxID=3346134 RepID=UPI00366D01E4
MSESSSLADRFAIVDVLTRMFVYTDQKRWDDLLDVVFTPKVDFDGGFGGPVGIREAADIVGDWRAGLSGLDAVHHQAGNYLIDLQSDHAAVHADAIAVHLKNDAVNGTTRTFIGSYTLGAERTDAGWRVNRFHYHLKVIEGNADLT